MSDASSGEFRADTAVWLDRASEAVGSPPASCRASAELARQGILLRRRWDRTDRAASPRRQILRLLPAVQSIAQQELTRCIEESGQRDHEIMEMVLEQLAQDGRYLTDLIDQAEASPESTVFAIECLRDDVHWLSTQVALLEGQTGIDFLGRILLEQKALQRDLDAWERQRGDEPQWHTTTAALKRAALRLQAMTLARQLRALIDQPEPTDWHQWHNRWRAASHLEMRLTPDPIQSEATEAPRATFSPEALKQAAALRRQAQQGWAASVGKLAPADRVAALKQVTEQLADEADESLTFVEDLPLADAVQDLEILHEDLSVCVTATGGSRNAESRRLSRTLRRIRYRVAGELQERRLAYRMEQCFGRTLVAAFERFILLLLLLFCGMLIAEGPLLRYEAERRGLAGPHTGQSLIEPVFAWLDLAVCLVFLADFALKMILARRRGLYLWRNWFTGLLPAIPVGFLGYALQNFTLAEKGGFVVLLRFVRYLRLPRMARWLRIARPALRTARLVGFALRASDRLVRQLTPLLNRDLLLFERGAIQVQEPIHRSRLSALRERLYYRAAERLGDLTQADRTRLAEARIEDLTAMLAAPHVKATPADVAIESAETREIPLERVIARLLSATPAGISNRIGRNVADSVSRWCGALNVFGLRRLPLVRDLVAASRLPSPYDTAARVANRIGLLLQRLLDRVYWLADLYGTVTAPQLVDSMGEYLVKGSARPARRLVIIGLALLAFTYLAEKVPALEWLADKLETFFGWPLILLGGICWVFFMLGLWLRQIAGEASEFYNQVADAQFITVTKRRKQQLAQRYREQFDSRVIQPEVELAGSRTQAATAQGLVDLIWSDYLDGAPFHASDTRVTSQMLGNLALVSMRDTRLGLGRRERARLRALDLVNSRLALKGPYLWFHFVSRSLSQQTARLIIDYNAFALPLARAETAEDWEILRFVRWLSRRLKRPIDDLNLPQSVRMRLDGLPPDTPDAPPASAKGRFFEGNDFSAVHFLTADPEVGADIRGRYGNHVADLVRRDRRDNIRRVFRSYPFHHWPRESRLLNPLNLYRWHLEGGRVLLLPLKIMWWSLQLVLRIGRLLWRIIREVVEPRVGHMEVLDDCDPFAVAVRKIHRMRKPIFLECLRMRAAFDPEYLGVFPPGADPKEDDQGRAQIQRDLKTLWADPTIHATYRQLAGTRRAQMADFKRVLSEIDPDDRSPAALRAMAIAYVVDYQQARSRLEATRGLQTELDEALAHPADRRSRWIWTPGAVWCRWRLRGRMDRLFQQPAFARYDQPSQSACRRLICGRRGELLRALRRLTDRVGPGQDPVADAKRVLRGVGRDPDTWTRQLLNLRAVQTLSVIDLEIYRDLVAELGEYDTVTVDEDQMLAHA